MLQRNRPAPSSLILILAAGGLLLTLACGGPAGTDPGVLPVSSSVAPTISLQPKDASCAVGGFAQFVVGASGTPDPTYQWRRGGSPLSGQTAAQLTLSSAQISDEGVYDVVVSNRAGTVTSAPASLSVLRAPTFTTQPVNQAVSAPAAATFSAAAEGKPAPQLQWQVKSGSQWIDIAGATDGAFSTGPTSASQSGALYRCVATNAIGSVPSETATLLVNPQAQSTLRVNLGEGVTGTPAATATYAKGEVVSYTYSLSAGFRDLQVILDGSVQPAIGTFRMDGDRALQVSATPVTHALTFTAGAGGTLTGAASQTVREGTASTPVTAVPDPGYTFANWTGAGFTTSTANPLVLSQVDRSYALTATFTKTPTTTYTVTFTAGAGGHVSGTPSQTVTAGGSTTAVTAVPDANQVFVNWTGTGFPTSTANPLTVTNVQQNLGLTATFAPVGTDLGSEVGKTPIDITFVDAKGVASRLSDYKGKTILLVCSEVYCNPCVNESKTLQALQDKYGPQGLVILENLSDFGTHKVVPQDQVKWAADAGFKTVPCLHDTNDLPTLYQITGYPTNILIGRDFKIRARQTGYSPYTVENMIVQGLK